VNGQSNQARTAACRPAEASTWLAVGGSPAGRVRLPGRVVLDFFPTWPWTMLVTCFG
jgi:hypothetical protein